MTMEIKMMPIDVIPCVREMLSDGIVKEDHQHQPHHVLKSVETEKLLVLMSVMI